MKKLFLLTFLLGLLSFTVFLFFSRSNSAPLPLSKVAFNKSLGIDQLGEEFILGKPLDQLLNHVAHQLIDARSKEWKESSSLQIPLEIHQIWIESGPLPDNFARGAQSIKYFHKNVPYTLWTKKEYDPLLIAVLGMDSTAIPKEILRDVVTAVLLQQKGGVVVDLACECVQPITPLLSLGDCIIGFEPPSKRSHFKRHLMLSSSVIAATPAHPLIKEWLKKMINRMAAKNSMNPQKFCLYTTQEALTSVVASKAIQLGKPLLVGPTYFYPINTSHIEQFQNILDGTVHHSSSKKIFQALGLVETPPFSEVAQETIFIHMKGRKQGGKLEKTKSVDKSKKSVETKKKKC